MLTLKKFDLKNQVWSADTEVMPVVYRNTLLELLYPDIDIAIGDASGFVKGDEPDLEGAIAALDAGFHGYKIDGASGSRKKGYALFTKSGGIFQRFFGSTSNAINYGSNLVTELSFSCELADFTLLVVKDGEYGTGDCHGKCSARFAEAMVGCTETPFQFRAAYNSNSALRQGSVSAWVAKGTIAYGVVGEYDLVLPESCFKGNKVTPGLYDLDTLYFGVVRPSEVRHVKMSYSVTQYLPWKAVKSDILPGTIAQAHQLVYRQSNPRSLAEYLLADSSIDASTLLSNNGEDENEAYVSPLASIIEADVHGQLIEHPWVVRQVKDMLRKQWLRLATAGAVQFQSAMTQPDDDLPAATVCIPHLPEGEVIVFPYPCRWKWDLQVWRNVHSDKWAGYEGIIAGSHSTMLTLGRDFDGDYLQFLPAQLLPNVAAAVKSFGKPPALTKPAKQKVEGTLAEIVVRSMDNSVGLITYAIAKVWAVGNNDIIPRLAQELQIEVDSLKNVQRADKAYIESVLKDMELSPVAWLKDHKKKDVFIKRPIKTTGRDTISRLAAAVNSIWQPFNATERSLIEFRDLFPANFPESWRAKAALRRDEFQQKLKATHTSGESLAAVIKAAREMGAAIPEQHKMTAAAAFWHVAHVQKSGTGSLVFHAFQGEICQQLTEQRFGKLMIVGSQYGDYAGVTWCGEQQVLTITQCEDKRFSDRLEARIGQLRLGLLAADSAKYPVGTQLSVQLATHKGMVVAEVA